jgi:hypothetical protein
VQDAGIVDGQLAFEASIVGIRVLVARASSPPVLRFHPAHKMNDGRHGLEPALQVTEHQLSISLISKLRDIPLAVVDVETTGPAPSGAIASSRSASSAIEGGRTIAEYEQLSIRNAASAPGSRH